MFLVCYSRFTAVLQSVVLTFTSNRYIRYNGSFCASLRQTKNSQYCSVLFCIVNICPMSGLKRHDVRTPGICASAMLLRLTPTPCGLVPSFRRFALLCVAKMELRRTVSRVCLFVHSFYFAVLASAHDLVSWTSFVFVIYCGMSLRWIQDH